MAKSRFHFEFGETVWWSYIESVHSLNANKHGIRVLGEKKDMAFSLPVSGTYLKDEDNGRGKMKMVIEGAATHTRKITTNSFRNTLKLLVERLDKKDKKNGNNILITRLTKLFPKSPYYNDHPEWFV